jgi:hypothetical protein
MFRALSNHQWMLCSCSRNLPLADQAILAQRLAQANGQAQATAETERRNNQFALRLGMTLFGVLGVTGDVDFSQCQELPGDIFGPVEVDGLSFGLATNYALNGDYRSGNLLLLNDAGEFEGVVRDPASLGTLLIARTLPDPTDPDACHADGDAAFPIDDREVLA